MRNQLLYELGYRNLINKEEDETPELTNRWKTQLTKYGTRFEGFKNGIFVFKTRSADFEKNGESYTETVRIIDWKEKVASLKHVKDTMAFARSIIQNSDLRIRCTCPDFGYRRAYVLTRLKSLYGKPERRPARITNPENRGAGCKHLGLVLRALPFYASDMARVLKALRDGMKEKK